MSVVSTDRLLSLALTTAEEAGELLLTFARRRSEGADIDESRKSSPTDPVSEADRAVERLIADRLLSARPDDSLLAEEGQAPRTGTSGLRWVVDPLDGTVNFLYGQPTWSVSIACEDEDGALVGVVHHPAQNETFRAERGRGAAVGDRPLQVTQVSDLSQTLVSTGFAYDVEVRAEQGRDVAELVTAVRDIRRGGSAALDLAWCAAGRVDAYVEFGLAPWDWAAGRLLVEEAGGVVVEQRRTYAGRELTGLVAGGAAAVDGLVSWYGARP